MVPFPVELQLLSFDGKAQLVVGSIAMRIVCALVQLNFIESLIGTMHAACGVVVWADSRRTDD